MKVKAALLAGSFLLMTAAPIWAHHAFAAEFDRTQSVTVTGTVTKVEWTNPHIWIYIDVKDDSGKVTNWSFQGGPPSYLTRSGWKKTDLKIGETITMQGYKAKDGANVASGGKATLADGRQIFAGTADDGSPKSGGER